MFDFKICFKCGKNKPLSEFYIHPRMKDGHLNKCKECTKKDIYNNRWNKRTYYKEYDRKRGSRSNNKYRHSKCSNCARDISKGPCAICGYDGYVEAHHEDYNKPKEIIWLCWQHHNTIHGRIPF